MFEQERGRGSDSAVLPATVGDTERAVGSVPVVYSKPNRFCSTPRDELRQPTLSSCCYALPLVATRHNLSPLSNSAASVPPFEDTFVRGCAMFGSKESRSAVYAGGPVEDP